MPSIRASSSSQQMFMKFLTFFPGSWSLKDPGGDGSSFGDIEETCLQYLGVQAGTSSLSEVSHP